MARLRIPLNNFAFGEINPSLTSRTDTPVYVSAAEAVQNFFIRSEGGVISRPGTKRIYNFTQTFDSSVQQQIRLEPFIFSDDEKYIIAFSDAKIECFYINPTTGAVTLAATVTQDVDSAAIPITNTNLQRFTFTQKGDFMFLADKSFLCRMLVRTGLTSFEVRTYSFETDVGGDVTHQPFYNFHSPGTRITSSSASAGTGRTLETTDIDGNDAAYFVSDHVGVRLRIGDAEATITAFTDDHTVTATLHDDIKIQLDVDALRTKKSSDKVEVTHALHGLKASNSVTIAEAGGLGGISANNINGSRTINRIIDENRYEITAGATASEDGLGGGSPTVQTTNTTEWFEQSYSSYRGFPAAITFHEDRLWFGGTPSQPDGLWGSRTGRYFNFDLGDASDDKALDLDAATGVTNQIRHLVSNRDLQVFASQSEFYLPSFNDRPLTPANAKISSQTPFGTGFVRPQSVDGSTLFVQATGTAVREYVFSEAENAYTAGMISLLSSHLIKNPVQLAVVKGSLARPGAYGFFLMDDGTIGVFHSMRQEKKAGWMRWTTTGKFHSIVAVDEDLFVCCSRDDGSGTTKFFLEQFDKDMKMDFCDDFTGTDGVFDVSGHFANGASVDVVDGTEYLGDFTVASGNATVTDVKASTSAQIGYKFTPELRTLPIDASVPGGPLTGQPRKITRVILDLEETLSVSVNGTDLILRTVQQDQSEAIAAVTGKREFRVLGYSKDPRITVTQSAPLALQINGLVAEVAF